MLLASSMAHACIGLKPQLCTLREKNLLLEYLRGSSCPVQRRSGMKQHLLRVIKLAILCLPMNVFPNGTLVLPIFPVL